MFDQPLETPESAAAHRGPPPPGLLEDIVAGFPDRSVLRPMFAAALSAFAHAAAAVLLFGMAWLEFGHVATEPVVGIEIDDWPGDGVAFRFRPTGLSKDDFDSPDGPIRPLPIGPTPTTFSVDSTAREGTEAATSPAGPNALDPSLIAAPRANPTGGGRGGSSFGRSIGCFAARSAADCPGNRFDGGAPFTGRVRPAAAAAERSTGDVVFVVDRSASMAAFADMLRLEPARRIVRLAESARFNVIFFNLGEPAALWPELRPADEENRRAALGALAEVRFASLTDPQAAVFTALAMRPARVELFSDGGFDHELVESIRRNNIFDVPVDVCAFGAAGAPGRATMRLMAQRNGGRFRAVDVRPRAGG
jgi:hypothetical protein